MEDIKDLRSATEQLPTHEEIQKRAYDLYSKSAQELPANEYWFMAEEELKTERAIDNAKSSKSEPLVLRSLTIDRRDGEAVSVKGDSMGCRLLHVLVSLDLKYGMWTGILST
jgi:hypothetical protein